MDGTFERRPINCLGRLLNDVLRVIGEQGLHYRAKISRSIGPVNAEEKLAETTIGLVIRQQAWFRAHVELGDLTPFPSDKADVVPINPAGVYRARVLLGRGPIDHELGPNLRLWFEHGEQKYPTFQTPSLGPPGAALKALNVPARVIATGDEAISLVEITRVQPVPERFKNQYQSDSADLTNVSADSPVLVIQQWMAEARSWLEQTIGLYAIYQYPIVWEPLLVYPFLGFVVLRTSKLEVSTQMEQDNFVPFRLRAQEHVDCGQLNDGALDGFGKLEEAGLHLPLLFAQRALWQKNVQARFLETFWILDYLSSLFKGLDPHKETRSAFFDVLHDFIGKEHPEHSDRLDALKHVILQAPARERVIQYLESRNVAFDADKLGKMMRMRNDLAHARPVRKEELAVIEADTRILVRDTLRKELEARGIFIARN